MKEYSFEQEIVEIKNLQAPQLPEQEYIQMHQNLVIACHDVVIAYQGGILLVERDQYPAKDIPWIIGGRIQRGMSTINSLKLKVKQECGLEIYRVQKISTIRSFFSTDPYQHGKGTDTISLVFFAQGKGNLKLDSFHKKPRLVSPANYTPEFRSSLHPFMRDMLDLGMKLIEN
jgi:ADP-ribose pyrophosphatase YjhB (NUDIX family)